MIGPFELAELHSHMVEGNHGLGLKVSISDLCYLLIPGRKVSQTCAPDSTLLAYFNGLASGCVLLPFGILSKRVLKSGFMYH